MDMSTSMRVLTLTYAFVDMRVQAVVFMHRHEYAET